MRLLDGIAGGVRCECGLIVERDVRAYGFGKLLGANSFVDEACQAVNLSLA